jgi:hypothetical protein
LTIGDTLLTALGTIRSRGWCQNALESTDGKVCAVGAVNHALFSGAAFWYSPNDKSKGRAEHEQVLSLLASHIPDDFQFPDLDPDEFYGSIELSNWSHVVDYNNAEGRTKQEIETWFEKAALDAGVTL